MTNDADRDPFIARALSTVAVPSHAPEFWTDLDARLADDLATEGSTGEHSILPSIVAQGATPRGRRSSWVLGAAAAVLVATLALVLVGPDREESVRVTPAADSSTTMATTGSTAPSTTVTTARAGVTATTPPATRQPVGAAPAKTGKATADGAVVAWIEALGAGRIDDAVRLVGPGTEAYIKALGGNVRGFMVESQEGYGAWAGSPDRATTEVGLGVVAGVERTVVVVSGTSSGEGANGYRTDGIPVARSGKGGTWLVEPASFNPKTGGRIEMVHPSAGESGLNGLAADATLEATAPGAGTFWFSLDDAPAVRVRGQTAGGGAAVRGTFNPPGDMPSRSHLLVVAYIDGVTFSAFAGVFAVEG